LTTDTPREEGDAQNPPAPAPFHVFASTGPLLTGMLNQVSASADPRLSAALLLLRNWDTRQTDENGDGAYDSPAVVLFNTWWRIMTERLFKDDLGSAFHENIVANLVYRLVVPNGAIGLLHDYVGVGNTVGNEMTASLVAALDRLQERFGSSDPRAWRQPVSQITWTPLGAGRVPNTIWMNRGTYNQLVHMGTGSRRFAFNVVAPGQSGVLFSPHFADQLNMYATWRYKPMRLERGDVERNAESTITLYADSE